MMNMIDRKLLTSKSEIINNKKGETRRKISSFQKSYDKFDKHYYDDNKEKTNIQKKCLKSLNKHFVKFGKHLNDEIEDYSKFGCPDDVIAEILLNNDDEIFIKTERLHETYDGKKFKRDVNNNNNKPVVDRSKICQQQQYVSNDLNDENKNSIIKNSNFNSPSKTIDSPNGNSYYWNKFTSLPSLPHDSSNSASKEEMSMLKQYPFKKYPEKLAQQNEQMAPADGKEKITNFWYSKGNKLIDRVKKMHKKLFSSSWFVDKQDKLKKVSKGISKNLEKVFSKLQKQYYKLMFSA